MKGGTPRSRTLWTFAITSLALVMVTLDNLVVTTALPVIRKDLGAGIEGPRMDGQRLHADLRRPAPDRRRARRPLRPPAAVRDRAGALHRRLGGGGARTVDRRARRRSRGAGRRRRDRHAADPDDPLVGGAGGEARRRARRLGRHRRPRGRARSARRRRGRLGPLLAVDLLDQRARRPRDDPARAAAPRRDPRPVRAARPARARPGKRGPARHRLGPRPRQRPGLGEPRDRPLARRAGRCSSPRSSPGSRVRLDADAADALLPQPDVRADERRLAADVLRDVRLDLPARAVLPDHPGLLAVPDRACASCPGRRCRSSSPRSPARSPTGSAAIGSWRVGSRPPGGRARLDRHGLGRRRCRTPSSSRRS